MGKIKATYTNLVLLSSLWDLLPKSFYNWLQDNTTTSSQWLQQFSSGDYSSCHPHLHPNVHFSLNHDQLFWNMLTSSQHQVSGIGNGLSLPLWFHWSMNVTSQLWCSWNNREGATGIDTSVCTTNIWKIWHSLSHMSVERNRCGALGIRKQEDYL